MEVWGSGAELTARQHARSVRAGKGTRRAVRSFCLAGVGMLTMTPSAGAFELSGGVSVGGILAGTEPHLTVTPHAGLSWPVGGALLLRGLDACSILPAIDKRGVGVYNQVSAAIGYSVKKGDISIGPSLAIYSMPACGATLCGRVGGVAPGGRAQINIYLTSFFGVSVSGSLDWIGGRSFVLPGGVAATVVAGPVLRWSPRRI